ncbi:unnamed protein product [Medioppia subpectinata]|uniref:Uncharacterized protein n=1 Tax=Medioppia subpectinata TaxID=1979941 RepID=A0A7R9KHK8_9ACAR|nr:unnamed protein product [Medioppia subpectinata]CAG2103427.1 unnamed protein product [Medioppia subpectinata]
MASATDWLLNNHGLLGPDGVYRENTYPEPVAYRPLNGTNVPIGGSLAFVLSQFGYDVWLGNCRSSVYSMGHTFLNYKTDSRYWMFSIDQIGLDDIPAMIQYVRDNTGQSKIGYIGHSLGCTGMFMLLSARPQFADVLTDYIALAPAVFVNNTYGLPIKLLSPLQFVFRMLPMGLEPGNVVPLQRQLQGLFCGDKIISIFCGSFLGILMGQNPLDVAYDRLGAFLSHFPNSISTWVITHLLQWAGTGHFQRFDYGPQENHVRYGQSDPPQYPLNNIKMNKISIIYSLNDAITEYRNVRMIKEYMTVPLYREILIPIIPSTPPGMIFSIYAPIMVDMKYILNTSLDWVSLFTTFETAGFFLGTFVGLLYKYVNRQLTMALTFILMTVASAVIPLYPNLWVLYLGAFMIGIGSSCYVAASTVWIIELWRGRPIPILQIFEFWFGIGEILTTVALKPYVVGETTATINQTYAQHVGPKQTMLNSQYYSETVVVNRRARLMIPTLVIGASILAIPISLVVLYFVRPYKTPTNMVKEDASSVDNNNKHDNNNVSNESQHMVKLFDRKDTPRRLARLCFALWFSIHLSFEMVFLKFCVAYFQYSPLHVPVETGTQILSTGVTVYTVGLALNIFYVYKFNLNYVLAVHYLCVIVGTILLVPAQHSLPCLWAASIMLLYGFSAMFAGIVTFTERYLNMTNQLSTLFMMIRSVFNLVTPIVVGRYLQNYTQIFIIFEFAYLGISLVMFSVIIFLIKNSRYKSGKCGLTSSRCQGQTLTFHLNQNPITLKIKANLDQLATLSALVQLEAFGNFSVDTNVHEIALFMCEPSDADTNVGAVVDCRNPAKQPPGFQRCYKPYIFMKIMSAMGPVWQLPPDTALPLGTPETRVLHVLTIFHHTGPHLYGRPLEWTVRLWHSDPIRPKEMQLLPIGLNPSAGAVIPAGRKRFVNVGHCSNQCFKESAPDGFNITIIQPHFNHFGTDLVVRHFRNGKEMPSIYEIHNVRDIHLLRPKVLAREVHIGADDTLSVECTYDSTRDNRNYTILHMFRNDNDEMCNAFIYKYPPNNKINMCLSAFGQDFLSQVTGFDECSKLKTFPSNLSLEKYMRQKNDWSNDFEDRLRYSKQIPTCSYLGWKSNNQDGGVGYPDAYIPEKIRAKLENKTQTNLTTNLTCPTTDKLVKITKL